MSTNLTQINTTAVVALTRFMQEKWPRRECILKARDELMNKLAMTRDSAELACWRIFAELETRKIPAGHYIDIANSTAQLIVIKSPNKNLVFTLSDLLEISEQLNETIPEPYQQKPTLH